MNRRGFMRMLFLAPAVSGLAALATTTKERGETETEHKSGKFVVNRKGAYEVHHYTASDTFTVTAAGGGGHPRNDLIIKYKV